MTTFTHHPVEGHPWTFDPTRTYKQTDSGSKPFGFWLSVDDDWRRWCESEEWGWGRSVDPVEVALDVGRCLWLKTVEDIDQFTNTYTVVVSLGDSPLRADGIAWSRVAQQYAGIIIAPYQWERRCGGEASGWYYPWDCASACIWDLSAVRVAERTAVAS